MISRVKKIVSVLCLVAALCAAALLPVSGYCENLRFVFLADSRNSYVEVTDPLKYPINTAVLIPIIKQIYALTPPPAFVIFGGDGAYRGYTSESGGYTFQPFKDLFANYCPGIPLYTTIGNHELYYEHAGEFILGNQQQFQQVFTENGVNGPSGYDYLAYSFTSPGGDAFFAVLDPYYLTADVPSDGLGGTITSAQLTWLKAQVAQTQATHKFLFIHTPYYYVTGGGQDEPSAADVTFTYLWQILDNNSFDFYACGHEHLYARRTIDSTILPYPQPTPPTPPIPPWQNNVVQLTCGTCGATVDQSTPTVPDPASWNIGQAANTYYFSVVDINGGLVTVNSWSYNSDTEAFSIFDTFTINKSISEWTRAYARLVSADDLSLLRRYRDKVLSKDPRGQVYEAQLYQNAGAALTVLLVHPELLLRANNLIDANMGAVIQVLQGHQGTIYDTKAVLAFLQAFGKKSPPHLQALINAVQKDLLQSQRGGKPFLGFRLR
jgi:hypothetical protein